MKKIRDMATLYIWTNSKFYVRTKYNLNKERWVKAGTNGYKLKRKTLK